jgi:membrane protein DedA with SNARE-associated domain
MKKDYTSLTPLETNLAAVQEALQYLQYYFHQFGYFGIFLILFITAASPAFIFPEEVVYLTLGYSIALGFIAPLWTGLVVWITLILADITLYLVGRYGLRRMIVLFPKRKERIERGIAKGEALFQKYGVASIFFTRAVPGPRTYMYMGYGFFHHSFWQFNLVNALAVVVHTSLIIALGYLLSDQITLVFYWVTQTGYLLLGILVVAILVFVGYRIYRKRRFKRVTKKDATNNHEI